ncbi:MAG: hypothetical protein ACRDK7_06860, partial [Solirubrobacteraceae bacterium]
PGAGRGRGARRCAGLSTASELKDRRIVGDGEHREAELREDHASAHGKVKGDLTLGTRARTAAAPT